MLFKRRKKQISLVNDKWEIIFPVIMVDEIPRIGEYIYYQGMYYKVLNIVHNILEKHGIFIVVDTLDII